MNINRHILNVLFYFSFTYYVVREKRGHDGDLNLKCVLKIVRLIIDLKLIIYLLTAQYLLNVFLEN